MQQEENEHWIFLYYLWGVGWCANKQNEKEQKKNSWLIQFSVKWLWNNKCLTVIISWVKEDGQSALEKYNELAWVAWQQI